jgi:hypothetical protein
MTLAREIIFSQSCECEKEKFSPWNDVWQGERRSGSLSLSLSLALPLFPQQFTIINNHLIFKITIQIYLHASLFTFVVRVYEMPCAYV